MNHQGKTINDSYAVLDVSHRLVSIYVIEYGEPVRFEVKVPSEVDDIAARVAKEIRGIGLSGSLRLVYYGVSSLLQYGSRRLTRSKQSVGLNIGYSGLYP